MKVMHSVAIAGLGAIAIPLLAACTHATVDSSTNRMPMTSVNPPAALIGTWEGQQLGSATTQAIVTFTADGKSYTLLKNGVDYTALASPMSYRVNGDRTPIEIDLQNDQNHQNTHLWGILELSISERPDMPVNPEGSMGEGTPDAPLTATLDLSVRDRLRLSVIQASVPRPRTFEPQSTINLTRQIEPPFNISPSIARQGLFYLEVLIEQQLANYIQNGQFSDRGRPFPNSIALNHYSYAMEVQPHDRVKITAIPNDTYLPSFTAVVLLNQQPLNPPENAAARLLTATTCSSSGYSRTPPASPTLQAGQWICPPGSVKPGV